MAENTVKVGISFESLLEAISLLAVPEKRKLWEFLEAELFQDRDEEDEDSPETIAEIQAARTDYQAGNYLTLDQYLAQQ
ncbi:hypothetical protein [Microseira wollei]|uniref:Uncharacterized protein n=1 Tax=Microseira wollei NIES-4236 TaxID=2530354 RepID=A0AAV3XF85_9CYAN|nr:hypothetical protein [Microseira wollei]GET39037.1 hypothetical protein MiSe_37980 [Microseira wollei NIES-4236]